MHLKSGSFGDTGFSGTIFLKVLSPKFVCPRKTFVSERARSDDVVKLYTNIAFILKAALSETNFFRGQNF